MDQRRRRSAFKISAVNTGRSGNIILSPASTSDFVTPTRLSPSTNPPCTIITRCQGRPPRGERCRLLAPQDHSKSVTDTAAPFSVLGHNDKAILDIQRPKNKLACAKLARRRPRKFHGSSKCPNSNSIEQLFREDLVPGLVGRLDQIRRPLDGRLVFAIHRLGYDMALHAQIAPASSWHFTHTSNRSAAGWKRRHSYGRHGALA